MPAHPTSNSSQRVLLLADPEGPVREWLSLFEHGSTRIVTTVADAQTALQGEQFDFLMCPVSELLPLARAADREQRHRILDGIAQGICVVNRDGDLVWSNAAVRAYPPEVAEAVHAACAAFADELATDTAQPTRHRALDVGHNHYFDVTVSALHNADGQLERLVGLVCDTTAVSRMRAKLDAIDAAGRELVALDADATQRLDVSERLQLLEDNLIRYCRDLLDYTHFGVLVVDPKTNRLDTVLATGISEQAQAFEIFAVREGNGISGYVAATGQSYICSDTASDPLYLSGYEAARSSLTVPLRLRERVIGVLNVESDQPAAFTEEDRQVAEIFGRYVAAALEVLKLLVVERSEATGQATADMRSEVATPLNEIIAEATHLLQHEPGCAGAQQRLRKIIDQVDRVKEVLQSIGEAPAVRGLVSESDYTTPVLQGKRVLIADDEEIIRETVADVLSKAGALTVMARDGQEAESMIRSQHFDLVLSDIKMPYKNGYQVFATAKEVNRACPVILITGFGYDPEHSIVRASREGLAGILFKPFKVEQLMEMVEKALGVQAG